MNIMPMGQMLLYNDLKFSPHPHSDMGWLIGSNWLLSDLSRAIQMVQILCIPLWTNPKSSDFTQIYPTLGHQTSMYQ